MSKGTKPNTYAFIDSQNLNLGVQKVGWKMDWRKFRAYLEKEHGVTKAYLFIGYMADNEAMYNQLHELGYLIVLKPTVDVKQSHEPSSDKPGESDKPEGHKPTVKGNIDAELVLYAMKELPNYEKAIIVSGDGDFYCLVEYLLEQKKLAHVLTPNWQYSSLLRQYDDHIIRLDQLRRQLAYHDRKKK